MLTRTISGIVFLAVVIGGFLLGPVAFGGVFAAVTLICLWEFYRMFRQKGVRINLPLNLLGGIYLFTAAWLYGAGQVSAQVFLPYLLVFLLILCEEVFKSKLTDIDSVAYSLFGQLYIAIPMMSLCLLVFGKEHSYHPELALCVFIFIWISDTFAYLTGRFLGKHHLIERISPHKTVEGLVGGLLFTLVAAALFHFTGLFSFHFDSLWQWLGFALLCGLFGVMGDLFESTLKRVTGVKDSGRIMPGHGGLLDRFDSSLMALPAAACFYLLCF